MVLVIDIVVDVVEDFFYFWISILFFCIRRYINYYKVLKEILCYLKDDNLYVIY